MSHSVAPPTTRLHLVGAGPQFLPVAPPISSHQISDAANVALKSPIVLTTDDALQSLRHAARTIANTNRLRILAVGASVTAGCGSAEPPFDTRCAYSHNKSAIPMSRQCTLTGGWVRRLHDALPDALRQSGWHSPPRISTSVHAKNAVGAGFFARCTSHWMPHGVDIVLLDLAQVLAGLEADFSRLVDAIRHTAPRAAIVFIAWRQQGPAGAIAKIKHHATALGVDVLRIDLLMRELVTGWAKTRPTASLGQRDCRPSRDMLYAQHGLDKVHPSPEGHALMATIAARFLATRLLAANASLPKRGRDVAPGASKSAPPSRWEQCFLRADKMLPLVQSASNRGWRLVDEGSSAKGVQKLGLLSQSIGDVLRLGPVGPGARVRCDSKLKATYRSTRFMMEVGYKLSPNPDNGAFTLGCEGACSCHRLASSSKSSSSMAKQLGPFPSVDTNARINPYARFREPDFDATISFSTVFFLDVPAEDAKRGECVLTITHAPAGTGLSAAARANYLLHRGAAPNRSVVRIDSLSAWCDEAASKEFEIHR